MNRTIKNKTVLIIVVMLVLVAIIIGGGLAFVKNDNEPDDHEDFHIHAGFKIFVNDELLDLSASKYMHFSPCSIEEKSEPLDVKDKIHLHENIGDVAHVHSENTVWRELFESLKLDLEFEPLPVMFVNGENASDLLNQEVNEYDSAVFIFGSSEDVEALKEQAVSVDYIQEAELAIESCGS